ncbi:MAG: hypothetical protein BWY09_00943 [Candidatus Hydrogenedentes bacterium ADurb.Bin179]|nr:MAG: hypothetical protein BWY09_00943 [Candidatus Hydrogenedentes bacterium ADurb.Bin179]
MKETVSVTKVAYTLEYEGKFMLIEGVPARVCRETGEQFFLRIRWNISTRL